MLTIISNSLILVIAPAIPMMAMTTAKRPRDTPNPARAFTRLPILKDPMEMFSSNGIYCAAYAPPFSFIIAPPINNEMPAIYKLIKNYFKNIKYNQSLIENCIAYQTIICQKYAKETYQKENVDDNEKNHPNTA